MPGDTGSTVVADSNPSESAESSGGLDKATVEKVTGNADFQSKFAAAFADDDGDGDGNDSQAARAARRGTTPGRQGQDDSTEGRAETPAEPVKPGGSPEEQAPKDGATPTLPRVLLTAAKRNGWSQVEAEEFFRTNPDKATDYFQRMLRASNELSARFGKLGQQAFNKPPPARQVQQQRSPQKPAASVQTQQEAEIEATLDDLMQDGALEKLAQDEGETLVNRFIKPLLAERQRERQETQEMRAWFQVQRDQQIAKEANDAMADIMQDLPEVYGDEKKGELSDAQRQARLKVFEMADYIRAGSKQSGDEMSVADAIMSAHQMLAGEHLALIERKKIQAAVKNRSAQITSRPTQRKTSLQSGMGEPSREKAIEAYRRKRDELGQ